MPPPTHTLRRDSGCWSSTIYCVWGPHTYRAPQYGGSKPPHPYSFLLPHLAILLLMGIFWKRLDFM